MLEPRASSALRIGWSSSNSYLVLKVRRRRGNL
jgi:hypothetical protein